MDLEITQLRVMHSAPFEVLMFVSLDEMLAPEQKNVSGMAFVPPPGHSQCILGHKMTYMCKIFVALKFM